MGMYIILSNKSEKHDHDSHHEDHETHEEHREHDKHHDVHEEHKHDNEGHEEYLGKLWEDPNYNLYVAANGQHFNRKSAEWALQFYGIKPHWSLKEVESTAENLGVDIEHLEDLYFKANKVYSKYNNILKSESMVLSLAIESIKQAYEGKHFVHFTADAMSKKVNVPWLKFK